MDENVHEQQTGELKGFLKPFDNERRFAKLN